MRSESPKVSFNRDVHVKRISSRGSSDGAMRSGGVWGASRRTMTAASSSPNGHHHHHHQQHGHQGLQTHQTAASPTFSDHEAPSKTRRKHRMVSRGVGTSDSRSPTPVIIVSTASQTSARKKSSAAGAAAHHRDKFSTMPVRGSASIRHREAKEERFGSLERQKTSRPASKERKGSLEKKQLSPIIEQESPPSWPQEEAAEAEEVEREKRMANGTAKKEEEDEKAKKKNSKKETNKKKKKKESLGQRMRQLFGRKKKDKNKEDEKQKQKQEVEEDNAKKKGQEKQEDAVRTRYTEYRGTDATDNETDQYAIVVPSAKRHQNTPPREMLDSRRSSSDQSKTSWYGAHQHHEGRHMSKTIEEKVYQFEKKASSSPSGDLRFTGGHHLQQETEEEEVDHQEHHEEHVETRTVDEHDAAVRHNKSATTEDEEEQHSENGLGAGGQRQLLRHGGESSGGESTTEDHSVHSHKSVVYLHSAAVVDIPGSGRGSPSPSAAFSSGGGGGGGGRRRRTVTRSVSVTGPWAPRGLRPSSTATSARQIDYSATAATAASSSSSTTLGRPPRPPPASAKRLVFTGPSFDPDRFRQPAPSAQRTANGKTRK